ncbi:MAG TPA: SIMPL domain-containing protein [Candidatus Paceibacterota bacterium]|nr:SIMPL domain-containing protein [Candidatus Paceibacterota bacterium]
MNSIFSDVDRNRAAKILLVIGALAALFLVGKAWNEFRVAGFVGRDGVVQNTITVDGRGEVNYKPDIATFTFAVTEEGKTVAEAQAKSSERMDKALKFLKDSGVEDKDVKTTGYHISPKYSYQTSATCVPYGPCVPPDPKIVGYTVSQNVEVKVRKTDEAGDLLSGIGNVGVQNVSSLMFSVDDEEKYKREARAKAIEDARAKAKALASDLDVRIVRVVSFSEAGYPMPYYGYGKGGVAYDRMEVAPQVANVQVPSGENEVVSQVSITYEIR